MPPKKATDAEGSDLVLTAKNVAVLCAGLRLLESAKIPWKEVGEQDGVGISLARNAQRAFRDVLKKMNHDMKDGHIFRITEEDTPATPKKATNGKGSESEDSDGKAKTPASTKRKKTAEVDAEADDGGSPEKKPKVEEE